tara:strand:+ start:639 stop:1928 length:1290 start_codon:yes stop_codon:yes gene_type:complete
MSYRNPKYIDTSVQGSFDKLQNTINANVATMAKNQKEQKEKEEAEQNRQILAGTNQSQATITKNANYNTVGNQVTTGKVGDYFSSYPARAAELATELAKTPKPENYAELQAELTSLNKAPETMKGMLENAASFLNIKDMSDFDPNQNQGAILATQVLNNKAGYTEENGFSYDFRQGKGGSIEMVFSGEGYIPPTKNGEKNTDPNDLVSFKEPYVLNSAGMQQMQDNNQDLLVSTPKMSNQVSSAIKETSVIDGAEFDENGGFLGGGLINENILSNETTEENFGTKDKPTILNVRSVDRTKVETGLDLAIQEQIESFINPDYGNDGQARSVWNMRIAKVADATVFSEETAALAFPELAEDKEALKAAWKKGSGAWNYSDDLSEEQIKVFKVMYKKTVVDDIMKKLNSPQYLRQRVSQSQGVGKENLNPKG